jgi:DNA-binding NarL/FixJ family response regulator
MMRIVIVEDHAIVRAALVRLLAILPDCEITEVQTGEKAAIIVERMRPQLVVLDLNLPGLGGLELLRRLLRIQPALPVLVFGMHSEAIYAVRTLQAGARGYVSKNAAPEELLTAVRIVLRGESYVEREIMRELCLNGANGNRTPTPRELEIMRLLAQDAP